MDGNNWRPTQGEPSMDGGDWRTQLIQDSRQRIVNKIMETLKRHLPIPGPEGLVELRKIAVRFEEKIYNAATSQSDYLRKISMKMLTMESRSQGGVNNSLPSNPGGNQNPLDAGDNHMDLITLVPWITCQLIKKSLPVVEFAKFAERSGGYKEDVQKEECAVCLGCLEGDHQIRELSNCSHIFHFGCLDEWVDIGKTTCPICRSKLLPEGYEKKADDCGLLEEIIRFYFSEDW